MDYTNLRNTIRGMQDEIIGGIQDCIRIDSVGGEPEEGAPYGPGPKKALEYALHLGKTLGFRTANVDNKAGYIEMGEGDEMIAVLGHLDVVLCYESDPGSGTSYRPQDPCDLWNKRGAWM